MIHNEAEFAIETYNICKSFGKVKVLDNLNLKIRKESSNILFGPSGCGKTTLLRLIAGLEVPDSGYININNKLCSNDTYVVEPNQREIGFVFQISALWPHMTVKQNICFGLGKMNKKQQEERLQELLETHGLKGLDKRFPHELSGGQARRVSIARTLAPMPKILLMDEPLTNLDSEMKGILIEYITDVVRKNHLTLLYVTHDEDEAARISGNMIKMESRIYEKG